MGAKVERVDCDFCGSADHRVKYQVRSGHYYPEYLHAVGAVGVNPPEVFTAVECADCGLFYMNPRYAGEELAAVYPDEQYTDRAGCFSGGILLRQSGDVPKVHMRGERVDSVKNIRRLQRIGRHKQGGRILDVGCNNGSFLALMEREGWETYGVDFSSRAIENARAEFAQERTYCGQLQDAGFEADTFDVVTLYDTIEHLPNPRAVLQEIDRICKPDALIVIQTIDFDSLNARLTPRGLISPSQHLCYFRRRDLVGLMRKSGFEVAKEHFDATRVVRPIDYWLMYRWARAMVRLHREGRSQVFEWGRRLLRVCGVIFERQEMLRRLKLVGANHLLAFRASKTFYFIKTGRASAVVPRYQEVS